MIAGGPYVDGVVGPQITKTKVPDDSKNYPEPQSHIDQTQKNCLSKICPCFVPKDDGFCLTSPERNAFGALLDSAVLAYNPKNQNHEKLLRDLYDEFVQPKTPPADPATLTTPAWGSLGFQGTDPRTDFRGGGFVSLQHLVAVCRGNPQKLQEMKAETANGRFFLACTSIGCTFWVKNYFHLTETTDKRQDYPCASRRAFKTFCRLLTVTPQEDIVSRLQSVLLVATFDLWVAACNLNPSLTIADLGSAEKLIRQAFIRVFQTLNLRSITDAENSLLQQRVEPRDVKKFGA